MLVLTARLADALERLLRSAIAPFAAKVAEADDAAKPFVGIDDR